MVNTGKFIVTFKYSGFHYGLSREVLENIAREGLATCVHLEIELCSDPVETGRSGEETREQRGCRPEIEEALRRVDMYTRMNQDFPGFFDAAINVDDYDEAFSKLSRLLEEFLGLVPSSESKATVPAEEASLQRRQQLAKQGLMGKTISSYAQLFERDALRVAGPSVHSQFLEPPSFTSAGSFRRSMSPVPPTTTDQRYRESGQPAKKSLPDPGSLLSPSISSTRPSRTILAEVTDEKRSRQEADRPADSKEKKTPKHKAPSPHLTPTVPVRPGSNTKPVLPPIPSGRKKPKAATVDSYASVMWLKP
ncbi:hypothetical protein Chor_008204 [Crotalus horridus]